jgi:exoribonuclease R
MMNLRQYQMMLVDEMGTKSPEDAFAVLPAGGPPGTFTVRVSILDLSQAVPRGSKLDQEARTRGINTVQDGLIIRAIPSHVQKDVAYKVRVPAPSILLEMLVSKEGEILSRQLRYVSVVPVLRVSTLSVESALLDVNDPHHKKWRLIREVVAAMAEFNGIDINYKEISAHILVSQIMTVANVVITEMMTDAEVPMVYMNQVNCGGVLFGDVRQAFSFLGLPNLSPLRLGFFKALNRMPSVSWRDLEPHGHEGLGIHLYGSFTSPLRNYANLVNFRCLLSFVLGGRPPYSEEELREIVDHFTALEQAKADMKRGYSSSIFLAQLDPEHVEYCVHGPLPYFLCLLREVLDGLIPITEQIREIFSRRFALLSPATHTVCGQSFGVRLRPVLIPRSDDSPDFLQ